MDSILNKRIDQFDQLDEGRAQPHDSASILDGKYILHEELGCGGFGKVKLATHILTQQKVAIKIVDKKAIVADLPRIYTELNALMQLPHQHVCRLLQRIETSDRFFIIMELCSGGELFDYIIKKARLEESEARHFFRQLVSAIAYIHSQGFSHRDLKPENLLLTDDLRLKVIDFGLCASSNKAEDMLETCCGSPAYAAPEVVRGEPYAGSQADVWSMGVLLYALLCGHLPFDDMNIRSLYQQICSGKYYEPDHLSEGSKKLLREMLEIDPTKRITVQRLLEHPWVKKNFTQPIKPTSIYDKNVVDEDVAREMAFYYGKKFNSMINIIREWRFDYVTATYLLLLQMKQRGQKFVLPLHRHHGRENDILTSPTIHSSLDREVDSQRRGKAQTTRKRCTSTLMNMSLNMISPIKHKESYVAAIDNMNCNSVLPKVHEDSEMVTPRRPVCAQVSADYRREKENIPESRKTQRAASVRVRGPVRVTPDGASTPRDVRARHALSTPRPVLETLFDHSPPCSPATPDVCETPVSIAQNGDSNSRARSTTKTKALRTRIFASLERKADRVVNLLTPRKHRALSPQTIRTIKISSAANVSTTGCTDPERVRRKLIEAFNEQGIEHEVRGWKISGLLRCNNEFLKFELEVVKLDGYGGHCGIRRSRLNGPSFLYKKVCEEVLALAAITRSFENN